MDAAAQLPPLALYVHFPWCVRKCPYCDFNSHALHAELPEARYVEALLTDLAHEQPYAFDRPVQSIFLGGGTPSLFSPRAVARLLEGCARTLRLPSALEVTLEANPGTIERGRFADYREAGVTRVSLGAQSFSDAQLQRLGRIHAADDTRRAAEELHAAGLANFNLDLMYGLPAQSEAEACADVQAALSLSPAHISLYQLTLEPGTLFAAHPPEALPDADRGADLQHACQQRLAAAGFAQYEVSAYARAGARCGHNLNYWEFGDYLGIGAGAHGKRTLPATSALSGTGLRIERTAKWREPRRYLAAVEGMPDAAAEHRTVAAEELPFEYLMNALRLREGFAPAQFEARTGLPREVIAARWQRQQRRGLLEVVDGQWRASERGFDLLNELLAEFLPAPARGLANPSPRPAVGSGSASQVLP
ncbi:MAG TPA: radical SAM family heme chaperone HemW [Steroidobacteraceae bacterium]|jgi:oxygen-independent coproporphyrinogen-3 oxidase|nr:radical SAM family heme chaperone HemW [Steroidobacteraceae bacterium]